MKKRTRPRPPGARIAEPVQVYLADSDLARLERLTRRLDATKSDVLRQGLAALEAQSAGKRASPPERVPLPVSKARPGLRPSVDLADRAALRDLMEDRNALL